MIKKLKKQSKVVKKAVKKVNKKAVVKNKKAKKNVKATVFKEVQEAFIVRQGKLNKTMSGFWIDFPMEAKEQIVTAIKEEGIESVKVVKLGHNKVNYFFPTKLSKTKKTSTKRGMVMKIVSKHFPYSSLTFIKTNGTVELKRVIEEEGKRAVKYRG